MEKKEEREGERRKDYDEAQRTEGTEVESEEKLRRRGTGSRKERFR